MRSITTPGSMPLTMSYTVRAATEQATSASISTPVRSVVPASEMTVTVIAEARTTARTGAEMEALVACSVAALTVYDMVKGIEPGVVLERVELLDKTGGKADFHR